MEEATFKLSSLLDALPQSENKILTIEEINLVVSNIAPSTLKRVVPNLSFYNVFECLSLPVRYEPAESFYVSEINRVVER